MDLEDQQRVIEAMREELDPPPGITARLAGTPVIAAQANAELASPWRRLLTLIAGLAAVALVLLAVFRRAERALVPLVPIALATGWSALVLFATQVPLNPMSATLGALVIAISTEFAVLLERALPPGARRRPRRRAGARAHVPLDRSRRARLRRHRDRRLRRARGLGLPHAARLRHRDGRGPDRLAARRADRAAVRARAGGAARAAAAHRAPAAAASAPARRPPPAPARPVA